jgi:hypothetical protein
MAIVMLSEAQTVMNLKGYCRIGEIYRRLRVVVGLWPILSQP